MPLCHPYCSLVNDAEPDKNERAKERPSDHVPLVITLQDLPQATA